VLEAVKISGRTWEYASKEMQRDPLVAMVASITFGAAKNYLDPAMTSNKDLVLSAVKVNGSALQFAADAIKADKEVVLAAVTTSGPALKFAQNGLNQDEECLKASGLWDSAPVAYSRAEQAIQSVKFSLAESSTQYATDFALAMKNDPFLKNFKTYNPNAWCKKSCDPNFTDLTHPCRGTVGTCTLTPDQNLSKDKKPCPTSCWRFAFRFHQEECKATKGFMIQVEEKQGLGNGQKIETKMAKQVDLKVFRTYTNVDAFQWKEGSRYYHRPEFDFNGIDAISKAVQEWYEKGCVNEDLENVFIGCQKIFDDDPTNPDYSYNVRPRYEKM